MWGNTGHHCVSARSTWTQRTQSNGHESCRSVFFDGHLRGVLVVITHVHRIWTKNRASLGWHKGVGKVSVSRIDILEGMESKMRACAQVESSVFMLAAELRVNTTMTKAWIGRRLRMGTQWYLIWLLESMRASIFSRNAISDDIGSKRFALVWSQAFKFKPAIRQLGAVVGCFRNGRQSGNRFPLPHQDCRFALAFNKFQKPQKIFCGICD